MPAGRPRGGNGGFRGHPAPMSERQQLALLLQLTSQEKDSGGSSSLGSISSQSTSSEQHRASRSRCRNERGETHLHVAAIRGDEVQVRRLLAKGADPNAKDFAGWTPLHEACNHGWLGTARILVEAGASVNALGLDDDTPLHDAAVNGHRELVKLLVDHGADSTLKNKRGKTPVDVASGGLDPSSFVPEKIDTENNHEESTTSSLAGSVESSSDGKDDVAIQRSLDTGGAASPGKQHRQTGSSAAAATTTSPVAEDSGDPCEMRRTLSQNKVDRSATGGSPRVTLRLNQVRSTRDDRRAATTSRHGVNSQTQNMDSYKTAAASSGNSTTTASHNNGNTSGDIGDVYEFKSSKEATPVRGVSTSPNPPNKDKDSAKTTGGNGNNASRTSNTPTASGAITPARVNETPVSSSPFAKRAWENESTDEQDEENRRKRRKDFETTKENTKAVTTGRQGIGRSNATNEKTAKPGKQGTNTVVGKNNQAAVTPNADRKSPNSSAASGSSPKPSTTAGSTNSKTATPAPPDSDGEDDRSKSSDSNSAPKVPPLKIVIPQSTASEQEQGNRNSKNTSNRNHQLPYVVPSSNSNDSTDKDQNQSGSGTTSPTEGAPNKPEDKKDFSGALHAEERSIHYQRVLRSSHRSGNGANTFATSKEVSGSSSGNGNYFNSSPLPATTTSTTDRSNDSSPQQRHHSPVPETTSSEPSKTASTEPTAAPHNTAKTVTNTEKPEKNTETNPTVQKDAESSDTASSTQSTTNTSQPAAPVELHPRKRKMKPGKEAQQAAATAAASEAADSANAGPEVHPHDQPITNCYELFLNIRQQIERRRKGLFPVQPKPPQGFKDYLMNRCTYVLAGIESKEPNVNPPVSLPSAMKDLYVEQEKERYRLRMQHVVEKEKLVLSVEQEILRVHGRAARALANQSLPFSVCTILKDEEVYNVITPEQEEKDRNARSRYNGRLFLSWLQDVDDKWEKIKEAMLMRHHNEAESLHAVQKMDWEWKMKEVGLCEFKARAQIEDLHVPMVHVSDDFDLLPA